MAPVARSAVCHQNFVRFDIDVKACARCGGRLEVRAVVSDHDVAGRILAAIPTTARAPPPIDAAVVHEPALA